MKKTIDDSQNSISGRSFFKGVGLFVFFLIAGWLIADLVLTMTGMENKGTVFETQLVDGRGLVLKRQKSLGKKNISEQGLRRQEILFAPQPDEIRILVLGDSSAYGVGMEHGQDFPTVLEGLLRAEGVPVTVMNGASAGAGFNQAYFDFLWFKQEFDIDLILIHGGWEHTMVHPFLKANEFSAEASAKRLFPRWPLSLQPAENILIKRSDGSRLGANYEAPRAIVSLASISPFARYLNERTFPSLGKALTFKNKSQKGRSMNPKEFLQLYLGLILQEAEKRKIPVVTVRPMSTLRIPGLMSTDFWEQYKLAAFNYFRKDFELLKGQIDLVDSVSDLFAKEGYMTLIDPQKSFVENINLKDKKLESIRKYFIDHQHFSAGGNRLIARFIKKELLRREIVKKMIDRPWAPEPRNAQLQQTSFIQN